MKASIHVVPCAGVLKAARDAARRPGGMGGAGLVHAALVTAERLEAPADLVLVAVPAGEGKGLADRLLAAGDRERDRRRASR